MENVWDVMTKRADSSCIYPMITTTLCSWTGIGRDLRSPIILLCDHSLCQFSHRDLSCLFADTDSGVECLQLLGGGATNLV